MNLISSLSSVSSSRRKWVFKLLIFTTIFILLFTTVVSAAEYNINYYYDSTYGITEPGERKSISYASTFNGVELEIINTDPAIFQMGRHYTFDAVFQINFGVASLYSSTYMDAINSLRSNGYTEEWYAHYIYGYSFYYLDENDYEVSMPAISCYVDPTECVVYDGNTCYTQFSDLLYTGSSGYNDSLKIQIKVHFDFDVNSDIKSLHFNWNVYQFSVADDYRGYVTINSSFDISNIISYDISTVGAMNAISVDIKSQIAGMESALVSSLDDLMAQQDRYWELLLGGYEYSNFDFGMGILYEIVNYQDQTYSEIVKIYSKVNSINTSVTNIKATSQSMLKLLNGTDRTLFDFLADNIDILHQDLIDIKDILSSGEYDDSSVQDFNDLNETIINSASDLDNVTNIEIPGLSDQSNFSWFSEVFNLPVISGILIISFVCILYRRVFE